MTEPSTGSSRTAWGYGLATTTDGGTTLDTWYPFPRLGAAPADATPQSVPVDLAALEDADPQRGVRQVVVRTVIDLDRPPADVPDAYLRLHLLSNRLLRPHGCDLTGLFGVLVNVVWTNHGPCAVEDFERVRLRLLAGGRTGKRVEVFGVDKFPRMTDYVVPSGVRIADADRVRLGAHLAPGTTVMHEGFVNFNAGTRLRLLPEDRFVKAAELSGASGLLFWRNSTTGVMEARPRAGRRVELNEALHANA